MIDVVFYFQVHQPYRLRKWKPADRIKKLDYFDAPLNRLVAERVAERCYLPMNKLLLAAIERTDGQFRCAFSLSGTVIQQLRDWVPDALDSFVALAESGNVEFLCETSEHSLAAVTDLDEFADQVAIQKRTVTDLFGAPTSFRDTELILDNTICKKVEDLGFECMLGEGADRLLGWRSPQVPYRPKGCARLKLLLRSYSLSDDIAFRFSNRKWPSYPLFADTYAGWLHDVPPPAQFIGLFMDYETFGEHQSAQTGILDFMRSLPEQVLQDPSFRFRTPAQVAAEREAITELDIATPVSWADVERNLSAWLGNPMQVAANQAIYALRKDVIAAAAVRPELLDIWRHFTTSDHVYYVATKHHSDAEVHEYFSPYDSPYAAFVTLMTAFDDLRLQVGKALQTLQKQKQ
ncbi:MAG: glycoside hydrolase family 57 protein [Planctomycetes bacterium]|nr:glycoside hydrolase family 57 protein [Planctomycetota bacterium]